MNRFRLLVFDWDGTLMDSEARIINCMQAAAADVALSVPGDDAVREIIGLGLVEAVERLFPGIGEAQVERVVERYRVCYLQRNDTPSPLFEGAREVIHSLHESDYMLAVATGKGRQGLDMVLNESGLGDYFLVTRCADEAHSKPHPQMLFQVMDELGVEPTETLMIGDTEFDLQMASNAGTGSLAVSYGVHSAERLMRHNPLGCLERIDQLLPWLENRQQNNTTGL